MEVFFSVGEPSGDLHGANLIRALRREVPDIRCVGYGGPRMANAGCKLHEDLTRLAVMWFLRVLLNIHVFLRLLLRANAYFKQHRPDAVVLIDYPGFNWWIARRAKAHGIPVYYYGTPQMWAWASWRVSKMRRLVDHVLCKLPFEVDWYRQRGCQATFVGHPFFDETTSHVYDEAFIESVVDANRPLVAILPGSRTQEVEANLEAFVATALKVSKRIPEARFAIASFNERQAEMATRLVEAASLPIQVCVGRTPELIKAADVCLACSGSVSLELLFHRKPTVIHYKVSRFAFFVQKFFRKVRYITLVNLLAAKEDRYCDHGELFEPGSLAAQHIPFPEYLTAEDKTDQMAHHLTQWLTDRSERNRVVKQLDDLAVDFAQAGASNRAAEYIVSSLVTKQKSQRQHAA
ncbi:MAG: lipid-A-disaccharide synthase [Pirellulaceae bacterium]